MIKEPLIPIIALAFLLGIPLALLLLHILRRAEHPGMKIFSALRLVLIFGLVFAIACRFKTEEKLYNSEAKNVDVLFVVDGTISMWAKDGRNGSTRIDQVRSDCRMIMEELPGASYGLVRFNNTSMVMSPYTQDTEAVEDALDLIFPPDRDYAKGSSLNTAYGDMEKMLKRSRTKKGRMTVVFFMSDGEITDGSELTSFQPLAELTDGGAVLGYGTEKGATMSVGYTLRDPNTMQDAVSCMDEGNLKQIAGDLKVEYIHPATGAGIKPLLQKIIQSSSTVVSDKKGVTYIDIAWKFAIPAAILLLMEVFMLIYRDRL